MWAVMIERRIVRNLLAVVFAAAFLAPLASGCGGDDEGGADCEDPERNVTPGSLQFNDACCSDAECGTDTGTCSSFNNKGMRCTKPCATDADCTGLGEGKCGGQGVCGVPG
jgi:hypothetical protein